MADELEQLALARAETRALSTLVQPSEKAEVRALQAEIRALSTSVLLDRLQFMRQAGITFGGARDEYEILGYDRIITNRQYRDEYARGGIAGRIVDALPSATWRGGFQLIEDQDLEKTTTFEQAWEDLDKKFKIIPKLHRVDRLAGLSTYAVLLIGAPGEMETELPKGTPEQLLYLTPFSGGGGPAGVGRGRTEAIDADVTIADYETDSKNPRFGLPKSYQLRRTEITLALPKPVHWTRIIHVAENLLDDEVFGQPALERVWNLLIDLRKVTGGGAEAFWLRANQGLHLDIDKDMQLSDAKATLESLKEQADLYRHQQTRWLRTKGVTVETLGSDVANFNNQADAILTQIAGAKAIPKRILTGSEMGELASSQDRDNWKDQINGRRAGYADPFLVRPLIDRLIQYGYLPTPAAGPDVYEVRWADIATLTEEEKVKGALGWSQVNQASKEVVFTGAEIRDKWAGTAARTEEQKKELADEAAKRMKEQQELMQATGIPGEEDDPEEDDDAKGGKKPNPFARRAAGDKELIRVLADAIECGATEVITAIVGLGTQVLHADDGDGIALCGEMTALRTAEHAKVTCLACKQFLRGKRA